MTKQYGTLSAGWITDPAVRVDHIPLDPGEGINLTNNFEGIWSEWSINIPYDNCNWGWGWYPCTATTPSLTLTLTEVMTLRDRAQEDDELRAILEKFTPHIRVEMDFPAESTPSEDL